MGLLDNVERGIEKLVRGAFSGGSASQVQPVEIASRLRRELDHKSLALAEGRTLAPNVFTARLSTSDFEAARGWGPGLAEELCDVVIKHVKSQNYTLQGPVQVSFTRDEALRPGDFEIDARTEKGTGPAGQASAGQVPAGEPTLEIDGRLYPLTSPSTVLGRSAEADITVDDTGVSRRHLEIRLGQSGPLAVDLGSTNGSYIDGRRLSGQAPLVNGSVITMGRTRVRFVYSPAMGGH